MTARKQQPRTGKTNNPNGRPKGVPNKATAHAREAIATFVDDNAVRMQGWLDQIAKTEGPLVAFRCLTDVLEYHVPKLARTEVTGLNGGPLVVAIDHIDERA